MEISSRNISIDPDYLNRKGYEANFVGVRVGLPKPSLTHKPWISTVLRYHHFSIVMHRQRRVALFTAVNIDGEQIRRLRREADEWCFDPRIGQKDQLEADFYRGNDFDLGHLVRRLDPAWGELAKSANDDTFHLTNAVPQCADFNRTKLLWAGLEDYLLKNSEAHHLKLVVFTGPVLHTDDPVFRGVQIPLAFWKVAVMRKVDGGLSVTGYILDQGKLVSNLVAAEITKPRQRAFELGSFRTFQVSITEIEQRSGLSFGMLRKRDALRNIRSEMGVELSTWTQIVL